MQTRTQIKLAALLLTLLVPGILMLGCQSPPAESKTLANKGEPPASAASMNQHQHNDEDDWGLPADAAQTKNPVSSTSASLAKGKKLYEANCAFCHGKTGTGDGPVAASLPQKPADLTNKEMMAQHTDGELFWKITKGKAPMPSFEKTLSEKDRWHVVNYVRTLAK